jgi:hypothetical protein
MPLLPLIHKVPFTALYKALYKALYRVLYNAFSCKAFVYRVLCKALYKALYKALRRQHRPPPMLTNINKILNLSAFNFVSLLF